MAKRIESNRNKVQKNQTSASFNGQLPILTNISYQFIGRFVRMRSLARRP